MPKIRTTSYRNLQSKKKSRDGWTDLDVVERMIYSTVKENPEIDVAGICMIYMDYDSMQVKSVLSSLRDKGLI